MVRYFQEGIGIYTMKAKTEKLPATSESARVCAIVLILVCKKTDLLKVLMINSSEQKKLKVLRSFLLPSTQGG